MNRSQFTIACTLVVLATTLAARIILTREPGGKTSGKTAPEAPEGEFRIPGRPAGSRIQPSPASLDHRARDSSDPRLTVREREPADSSSTAEGFEPSPRAARVEAHAHNKLRELDERLHLTADQKRRIFPLLASTSPDFDPSLLIGGTPGSQLVPMTGPAGGVEGVPAAGESASRPPDVSADIVRELDAGQQAIYEDWLVDDSVWWSEIIGQIEEDFLRTQPGGATPQPEVVEDPYAGENLFDLLGQ